MRPVLSADAWAAGCALLMLPSKKRAGVMLEMLHRAEAADRYRNALGHAHPEWGNGSLGAVAMSLPRGNQPFLNDPDFVDCMMIVFAALKTRQKRPNTRSA